MAAALQLVVSSRKELDSFSFDLSRFVTVFLDKLKDFAVFVLVGVY